MAMQPARQYMAFEQYLLLANNSEALDQALGDYAVCRLMSLTNWYG
jgi:hypothetical protein